MLSLPIIIPATMATMRPVKRYMAAISQPKSPNRSTRATSLTIGEEMRKLKVTPRGMPASTKPMNSGQAEQEQKGVTTPRRAASTWATKRFLPARKRLVRSGGKKLLTTATTNMMVTSKKKILVVSSTKKWTASVRCLPLARPSQLYVTMSARIVNNFSIFSRL